MAELIERLQETMSVLSRHPEWERSTLLRAESRQLTAALDTYRAKVEALELSLNPDYIEAEALLEGHARNRVTAAFIKDFTRKHCSDQLVFPRVDKRARDALLIQAARDKKLRVLKDALDPEREYRQMYRDLASRPEKEIQEEVMGMEAGLLKEIVKAGVIESPRTRGGAVSTSLAARKQIVRQIIARKRSDELMAGLE
ncbi:MAG: hypothetical protein AB1646_12670 [Thermodesulfobacteriota bacterium]